MSKSNPYSPPKSPQADLEDECNRVRSNGINYLSWATRLRIHVQTQALFWVLILIPILIIRIVLSESQMVCAIIYSFYFPVLMGLSAVRFNHSESISEANSEFVYRPISWKIFFSLCLVGFFAACLVIFITLIVLMIPIALSTMSRSADYNWLSITIYSLIPIRLILFFILFRFLLYAPACIAVNHRPMIPSCLKSYFITKYKISIVLMLYILNILIIYLLVLGNVYFGILLLPFFLTLVYLAFTDFCDST